MSSLSDVDVDVVMDGLQTISDRIVTGRVVAKVGPVVQTGQHIVRILFARREGSVQ